MSQRLVIRHGVVEGLRQLAIDGVLDRVWGNRTRQIPNEELPAIRVYTDQERAAAEQVANPRTRYVRTLDVVVEVVAKEGGFGPHELDDLDLIGHQVETWFFDREEFPELWMQARLARSEQGLLEGGKSPVGGLRIVFEVEYEDFAPRTVQTPEAFEVAGVEYDLAPDPDGSIDARDEIALPQS